MVRGAFRSKWRLHPGKPTLTEGRFFFVSDDHPEYPGWHRLDSRDWTSDERGDDHLGEYDGVRLPDDGRSPPVVPLPVIVGTPKCVEEGGGGSALIPFDVARLDRTLPAGCYPPDLDSPCNRIKRCPDRALLSSAMERVFAGDWESKAVEILGPGTTTVRSETRPDDLFSRYAIAKNGRECHIYIDGTRNQGQLLSQAFFGIFGPKDYGDYSANELYRENAIRVLRAATDFGCDTCDRFILIGHSYGGATAAIATAILRGTKPVAELALMTEGAPRAGGPKLIEWIRPVCQRHYRRPLDPIPLLPPQYDVGTGFFAAAFNTVALGSWIAWGKYSNYEFRYVLFPDGPLLENSDLRPPADVASTIVLQLVANTPLGAYAEHAAAAYRNELALGCGIAPPNRDPDWLRVSIAGMVVFWDGEFYPIAGTEKEIYFSEVGYYYGNAVFGDNPDDVQFLDGLTTVRNESGIGTPIGWDARIDGRLGDLYFVCEFQTTGDIHFQQSTLETLHIYVSTVPFDATDPLGEAVVIEGGLLAIEPGWD